MSIIQNIYWGYEISYPDYWFYKQISDTDFFVSTPDAFDPLYDGKDSGQIAIRGEWNWEKKDIKPLWSEHIGLLAGMLGAKDVGSADWRLGKAVGIEAEIVLPKKLNRRLWTGILAHQFCVLHFMVTHPLEAREEFEPVATEIIKSLKFPESLPGMVLSKDEVPLPLSYTSIDPSFVVQDISDRSQWVAFDGNADIGALQSFYLRELSKNNWEIIEYIPFTDISDLGFARYVIKKEQKRLILGLMPSGSDTGTTKQASPVPTRIVYKVEGS